MFLGTALHISPPAINTCRQLKCNTKLTFSLSFPEMRPDFSGIITHFHMLSSQNFDFDDNAGTKIVNFLHKNRGPQ